MAQRRPTSRATGKASAKPAKAAAKSKPGKAKASAAKAKAPAKTLPAKATKPAAPAKAPRVKAAAPVTTKRARRKASASTPIKVAQPKLVGAKAKAAPRKAAAAPVKSKARAPVKAAAKPAVEGKATKPLATKSAKKRAKAPKQPPYLAALLGQPTDPKGEPVGAGHPTMRADQALQDYTLQLWRQMQSGRAVQNHMRTIERAGFTADEVWLAGLAGQATATSSTPDEMRRYRQKVLFRANLLEAILSETVADLRRLEGIQPTPPETTGGTAAKPA